MISTLTRSDSSQQAKRMLSDRLHDQFVVSTLRNTHVFHFENPERVSLVESLSHGLRTDTRTLVVANMAVEKGQTSLSRVIQVTPKSVYLFDYDAILREYTEITSHSSQASLANRHQNGSNLEIVSAHVNGSHILLGLSGGYLSLLEMQGSILTLLV
jgi:hypothetical protein